MKKIVLLIIILSILVVGCVLPGRNPEQRNLNQEGAGFSDGIFHGAIIPINLIISFFNDDRSIYEVRNNGYNYNFGYFIGILLVYGGSSLSITRRKSK